MSKSAANNTLREAFDKRNQYQQFQATGKYRWGQIGIDKETNHIIFYPDNDADNEIYYILISKVEDHKGQMIAINNLIEKNFFTMKVLEEFLIALGVLGLMPDEH